MWRHWLDRLGERHTVLRYDERGCGLSDAEVGDPSVETWVGDLEAVVDAARLERFALLGVSQGAAIAVAYAARHPGARRRSRPLRRLRARPAVRGQDEQEEALVAAIRAGWTTADPAFRHVFSMLFLPDGTSAQMAWYDDLLRTVYHRGCRGAAVRSTRCVDVVATAPQVQARTLVIHARDDRVVPGRGGSAARLADPGCALGRARLREPHPPRRRAGVGAVRPRDERLPGHVRGCCFPVQAVGDLSPRELEVLELVAAGLTNEAISQRLFLSVRTVEHHLSNIYAKLGLSGKAARAAAAVAFIDFEASRPAPALNRSGCSPHRRRRQVGCCRR